MAQKYKQITCSKLKDVESYTKEKGEDETSNSYFQYPESTSQGLVKLKK
jgi:hypothetical protein